MATEITVPVLGESVTEGSIGEWLKQPGDAVAVDEPIASLETDKVAVDVPSPVAGVMSANCFFRRRLTLAFLGATSTSAPSDWA